MSAVMVRPLCSFLDIYQQQWNLLIRPQPLRDRVIQKHSTLPESLPYQELQLLWVDIQETTEWPCQHCGHAHLLLTVDLLTQADVKSACK